MLNINFTVVLLKPQDSFSQSDSVKTLQQVVLALLSACLHLLFPGDV